MKWLKEKLNILVAELSYLVAIFKYEGFSTNRTNWEHVLVAIQHQLAMMIVFGYFWWTPSWWIGAALGSGIFIGREYAQVERKILTGLGISTYEKAEMLGYDVCAMAKSFKYWNKDSLYDQWLPKVFVIGIAVVMTVISDYLV